MHDDRKNHEGYPDPTAHAVLSAMHREEAAQLRVYRPLVYICSPLAGDMDANMERARGFCRFAVDQGAIPIAPHLLFPQFMDEETPSTRTLALHMGLVLVTKCRELWYFGDTISEGMRGEIRKARQRNMPVRHFTEECGEVE